MDHYIKTIAPGVNSTNDNRANDARINTDVLLKKISGTNDIISYLYLHSIFY